MSTAQKRALIIDDSEVALSVIQDTLRDEGCIVKATHSPGEFFRIARGNPPPHVIITDLGEYRFDEASGEMTLVSMHPGVTLADIRENTGWEMKVSDDLQSTPAPTAEELRLIREELDPEGIYSR